MSSGEKKPDTAHHLWTWLFLWGLAGWSQLHLGTQKPLLFEQVVLQINWFILWVHPATPKKSWNYGPPVNTNKPWFLMSSKWCEMDFVLPQLSWDYNKAYVKAFNLPQEGLNDASDDVPRRWLECGESVELGCGSCCDGRMRWFDAGFWWRILLL